MLPSSSRSILSEAIRGFKLERNLRDPEEYVAALLAIVYIAIVREGLNAHVWEA